MEDYAIWEWIENPFVLEIIPPKLVHGLLGPPLPDRGQAGWTHDPRKRARLIPPERPWTVLASLHPIETLFRLLDDQCILGEVRGMPVVDREVRAG